MSIDWKEKADDEFNTTTTFHELDPQGKDSSEAGAKLDAGKPRASLVLDGFALALLEVAKVGTFGANKYSDNGWKQVENAIPRYSDASYRHQLAKASGETHDKETGLMHQAHKAWNELAVLNLMIEQEDNPIIGHFKLHPDDEMGLPIREDINA